MLVSIGIYLLSESRATKFALEHTCCHWIVLWNSNFYFLLLLSALITVKPLKHEWYTISNKAAELFRNSRTASVLTVSLQHSTTEINVDSTSEGSN